jgi:ribose transport system permease protein
MLVALIVTFSSLTPYFLELDNFLNIGTTAAALGIMAIVQTFLIVAGGFDVSVGSVIALSGVVVGLLSEAGWNVWAAAAAAVAAGAAVGGLNGFIVVKLGVNPLITTLGTLSLFSGLAFTISESRTLVVADEAFAFIGSGRVIGVPFALLVILVAVTLAVFIERHTLLGRAIYAIGGNREAARLAGLRVDAIPMGLYVASGMSGAIAGLIIT